MSGKETLADFERLMGEVWDQTSNKIKEMSFAYKKLGKMLCEIPPQQWELQPEEIEEIKNRVTLEICVACENFYECCQRKTDSLFLEYRELINGLEEGKAAEEIFISAERLKLCERKAEFWQILFRAYERMMVEKRWKQKLIVQRKMLAAQMTEIGEHLYDSSALFSAWSNRDEKNELLIKRRMKREKLKILFLRVFENRTGKKEIWMLVRKKRGSIQTKRIAAMTGDVLKMRVIPFEQCGAYVHQENKWLGFREDVRHQVLTGYAFCRKKGEPVSGDSFSMFRLEDGRQIYLLSDGMGSGGSARQESLRMTELMEQLLKTGFREEQAFEMANNILTFGKEQEQYASMDLLSVQLHTGLLKMIKMAGAPTFLLRKNRVEIWKSANIPAGILWNLEFDVLYKKLYDGDRIVIVSDGILGRQEGSEEALERFLLTLGRKNPQMAAEEILEWALKRQGGQPLDDMTVLVISVWRK